METQYRACRAFQVQERHDAAEQDHPNCRHPVLSLMTELLHFPGGARQGIPVEELAGTPSENADQSLLPPDG